MKKIDLPVLACLLSLFAAGLYGLVSIEPAKLYANGLEALGLALVVVVNVGFWGSLWQIGRAARSHPLLVRVAIVAVSAVAIIFGGVAIIGPTVKSALQAQLSPLDAAEEDETPADVASVDVAAGEPVEHDDPAPPDEAMAESCAPLKSLKTVIPPNMVKAPSEDTDTKYYKLGRVSWGEIMLAVTKGQAWLALDSRGQWSPVETALLDGDVCVQDLSVTFKGRAARAMFTLDNDRFDRKPASR